MSAISRESREYAAPAALDRSFDFSRINIEVVAFVGLVLLSVITHLWALGQMAMHHDESIHAWMSWKFFTGAGGFVCAGGRASQSYCYDPVYHGPSLYVMTLVSHFLFGDGEAQARLPQALCGVLLVASTWMLRPYLGRRGTLIGAALLAFAPSMLYFTRFARHDGLMVLWTLWMVIGFFRYLDTGRARFLYLLAAGVALAIATHELYYILFFLFGSFVGLRVLSELLPRRPLMIGLTATVGVTLLLQVWNPPITSSLRAGGLALLVMTVALTGLLLVRVWGDQPVVVARATRLWRDERPVLWTALGLLGALYVLLYSVFFTDPRGIIDGLYRGLEYWLGSQHEYSRGKQPWYYYLMLLPVYEPLALFGGIGAAVYLFARGQRPAVGGQEIEDQKTGDGTETGDEDFVAELGTNGAEQSARVDRVAAALPALDPRSLTPGVALFPLFLAFWLIGALVAFSWAGEKMPWLVIHIALPGNLLVAWALGRALDGARWRELPDWSAGFVPPALLLLLVVLGVALWRFGSGGAPGLQGQSAMLQGLVPLAIAGLLIFALLTIGQRIGTRTTLALCGLTLAGLAGAYMIRATWMVVYDHPDTPREQLIYVQSSPEVPLIVEELRELGINQTRNIRTPADPVGGHSLPVIMDVGDENGDGSLAWPFQWYLRDFQRLENRNADFFRDATPSSFDVQAPGQPDGVTEPAAAVLVYKGHVTSETTSALQENYVKRYDAKLNWWFPEGDLTGCDPSKPGYKQFYYSTSSISEARADPDCSNVNIDQMQYHSVFAPLLWPLDRSHWADTWKFLLWRDIPPALTINGREMEVWIRKDLTTGGAAAPGGSSAAAPVRLVAQQVIGEPGQGDGQLAEPRGVAVDAQGNIYVADTENHRVQVFGPDGAWLRSVGSFGSGDGQLNEPRGVALDAQGNLYVADTWNARVVKFDPSGAFLASWGEGSDDLGGGRRATMTDGSEAENAAEPLGLFGPRGVAVDDQGDVYIADTGNKRIVVTDSEGNYQYQWGYEGAGAGAFNEPIGVAVDQLGNVYVADTWNGRVQVFSRDETGDISRFPSLTWTVPGWQPNTYDDPYIAASPDGDVYVGVPSRDQVLYATISGDVLLRWGGRGGDNASLTLPSGMAVAPDGSVLVVDRGNGRVLRYTLPQIAPPAEE